MNGPVSYIDTVDRTDAPDVDAGAARRWPIRVRGLAVAVGAGTVLAIGAFLAPAPRLNGTHEQLGLPPCSFLQRTGWPCPSCGMTTSVCAMMHGRFVQAFKAHPSGVLLVAALAVLALAGAFEAASGREALHRLRPGLGWLWVGLLALPIGWGLKVLIGLMDGTLPVH